jgi:hypothetical protein
MIVSQIVRIECVVAAATRCKAGSIVRSRRRAGWLAALALIGLTFCLTPEATAACIDLKQANKLSFEGMLNYRIFAGPPNYEDVRKGDTPEPTYILTLTEPICASVWSESELLWKGLRRSARIPDIIMPRWCCP